MHFGLFSLMAQRDRGITARQLYQETVEQVKLAEAIGFDIAWFAEHHFSNYCLCPSPITMATCLAPQTTCIRLGTAVIVAPLYHPLRMLEDIGMLDVVQRTRRHRPGHRLPAIRIPQVRRLACGRARHVPGNAERAGTVPVRRSGPP